MDEIPEDLTSVGTHHGNQPPTKSGQTVRSPEGPDPSDEPAQPSPALFQLLRLSENRLQVKSHSPRAVVSEPDEGEEIGQYRTVEALQQALADASVEGWAAVFEEREANRVLVDTDIHPDHAWIGKSRYPTITFFEDEQEATAFAENHERPAPNL